MFKTVDEKLAEIGFVEVRGLKQFGVRCAKYERESTEYNYIHVVELMTKQNGYHIIQSYQRDVNSEGFNNAVGLTMYETKLFLKKMKQLGWKPRR
jgi:hypothetical protein